MAYIEIICPRCQGTHVVLNGKTPSGAQKCCCRDCGRTFQTSYSNKACQPGMKDKIIEMAMNGSGTRDTARVLGISKNTVTNTLRDLKKNHLCKHQILG